MPGRKGLPFFPRPCPRLRSSAAGAGPSEKRRLAAAPAPAPSSAPTRSAAAPCPAGRRPARGPGTASFDRPQGVRLIAQTADATVDQELDGARRLAHGDRDVFDLHVFLEFEDEGGALLGGQAFDQRPDAPHLIAMCGEVIERWAGNCQVMKVIQGLGRTQSSIAVRDRVDRDLIQPGGKRPPRVLVPGNSLQSLHKDFRSDVFCRCLLPHSRIHEPVNLLKMPVIERPELSRIPLRALDELSLFFSRRVTHWPFSLPQFKRGASEYGYGSNEGRPSAATIIDPD